MLRTEDALDFEERRGRLADFLRGRPCPDNPTDEDMQAWYTARMMLLAPEIVEAAEYALTLIRALTSEEFAAGGDKPARDRLADVIAQAKGEVSIPDSLVVQCAADIREAIRLNQALAL
jgi:hypothetical protein